MSHFPVLVIGDDVDGQLAPFNENNETAKEPKWDWWVMGGRWGGYFWLKEGKTGVLGAPSTFDKIDGDSRNRLKVDQARKGDIDFDRMRADEALEAATRYDKFAAIVNGLDWPESFDIICKRITDIDDARKTYWAQPMCHALSKSGDFTFIDGPEEYGPNRTAYVERCARNVARPFAVIKNQTWYEKGSMGWFGMIANEQDSEQWSWQYEQLIEGLPDDTLFTVVDCHI